MMMMMMMMMMTFLVYYCLHCLVGWASYMYNGPIQPSACPRVVTIGTIHFLTVCRKRRTKPRLILHMCQIRCYLCLIFCVSDACFCVYQFLVVSTSAIDCLERLVSKVTYRVSSGKLNPYSAQLTSTMCNMLFGDIWLVMCEVRLQAAQPRSTAVDMSRTLRTKRRHQKTYKSVSEEIYAVIMALYTAAVRWRAQHRTGGPWTVLQLGLYRIFYSYSIRVEQWVEQSIRIQSNSVL